MLAVLNSPSPVRSDHVLEQIRHADNAARELRHSRLVARMAAHQQGNGPAPTAAEVEQWKEDAAFQQVMGRLLASLVVAG